MKSEEIQKEIVKFAEENNLLITKYAPAIAEAKRRMGGDWRACPCAPRNGRYCGSEACRKEIEEKGVCHCNLFLKDK